MKGRLETIQITPKNHLNFEIDAIAFDGRFQQRTISSFYKFLSGTSHKYDLIIFVGHNALMEVENIFPFDNPRNKPSEGFTPKAAVIACASKSYFHETITTKTNAIPYVLTSGNMAPEAYVVDGILDAWMNDQGPEVARLNAAKKYAQYQKIPLRNAKWLFQAS